MNKTLNLAAMLAIAGGLSIATAPAQAETANPCSAKSASYNPCSAKANPGQTTARCDRFG